MDITKEERIFTTMAPTTALMMISKTRVALGYTLRLSASATPDASLYTKNIRNTIRDSVIKHLLYCYLGDEYCFRRTTD